MKLNLATNEVIEAVDIYVRGLMPNIPEEETINVVITNGIASVVIGEDVEVSDSDEESETPVKPTKSRKKRAARLKEKVVKTEEKVTKQPMEEPEEEDEDSEPEDASEEMEEEVAESAAESEEDDDEGQNIGDVISNMEGKKSTPRKKKSIFS